MMKDLFINKTVLMITSIILAAVISTIGFWHYQSPVAVEASGVVSVELRQGSSFLPGEEIISERTENAKMYYLANGSYALDVSMGAVHYKDNYSDNQEQWKDIDLTFKDNQITKAPYILSVNPDDKSLTVQDKRTGQTTSLRLTRVGISNVNAIEKKVPMTSKGKIQWENVADDLDLAITAENTSVRFDWIVKSGNAPHEVEFDIRDGGIPILYKGVDADGHTINVTSTIKGNKLTEKIEKGGKYPKVINPVIDVNIGASANDCFMKWNGASWLFDTASISLLGGYLFSGSYKMGGGLRFTNITIPASSTITSSYISISCPLDCSGPGVNTRITGNKENSPAVWSTLGDYQSRRGIVVGGTDNTKITTAQVNWDNIVDWTWSEGGNWYNSPNISTVIQELVNAHAPNNEALALFWDDHDNRSTEFRVGYAYDNGGATYAPKLHIEYTSFSNTPSSNNFGVVIPNSTVSTGLNYFTMTNNSATAVNVTISGTDITGGTTWTLSDTATPGSSTCGLKAGLNGGSYNVIVKKTAPYNTLKSNLAGGASQSWGLQILAPTNSTDTIQKSGNVTLTVTSN
jgi:hypothetical protein